MCFFFLLINPEIVYMYSEGYIDGLVTDTKPWGNQD